MDEKQLKVMAWGLSSTVALVAFVAWGQLYDWQLGDLSSYQLFPLFGLLAFSIMWSHYIAAALRLYFKIEKKVLGQYFEVTSMVVLAAIILHPGLLVWQLWRDGMGLPPGSTWSFVGPSLKWFVTLGMVSLGIFLAYEFRRWFAKRSWWRLVQYASDLAMAFVFIHSLKLGSNLQDGWFQMVWYFYGATFVVAIVYIYYQKLKAPRLVKQ
jgi:hypothetical protein